MGKGGTITLFRECWNAILFGNGDDINAFCWYGNIIWNYRPFKYYTTVVELFIHAQVAWELPCLLDKLWLNGMKLGPKLPFCGFCVSSSNISKHWVMACEKTYVARYPTDEGSALQNFRAMDQDTISADPLILDWFLYSVAKMSQPIIWCIELRMNY